MTPPRFDIYRLIHKGLRASMMDALAAVGRMDCGDRDAVECTLAQVEHLLDMCLGHLEHENRFIHTAIEVRCPGASAHTARDHVHHVASIAALIDLCRSISRAGGEERLALADLLYQHLIRFVEENFDHMRHEEVSNNAALWSVYTDEEILAIQRAMVAAIAPEKHVHYLRSMVGAINHGERVALLAGIRAGAATDVFDGILRAVEPALSAQDSAKLHEALGRAADSNRVAA